MSVKALTRAEAIAQWPKDAKGTNVGDFSLTELRTGTKLNCRGGAPINYCHSDWQYKTKADYDRAIAAFGRNWTARPALFEATNGQNTLKMITSFHTFNHSIVVAGSAFNIVSPNLQRSRRLPNGQWDPATLGPGFERDKNGNWNPGHHMCMHYSDSFRARSDDNYTRNMRAAVEEGLRLINATPEDPEFPRISRGTTNKAATIEAQGHINRLGYEPPLVVDGGFGPLTEAGVQWAQRQHGLPVTGVIDKDTWLVLRTDRGSPTVDEQRIEGSGYSPAGWAIDSTDWAILMGILGGTGGGNFDLQGQLTREQGIVLMHRFAERIGSILEIDMNTIARSHADSKGIVLPPHVNTNGIFRK